MDYYTTFSDVRANNLFTFFVACVAGSKREGEGKGEGAKGKYRGKDKGPCLFSFLPIPFTFQLLLRRLFFSIFFSRKGGPGRIQDFFSGGGALVSCFTSTPINHIVFFLQNTSCIRKPKVISGGGGVRSYCTLSLDPPLRAIGKELSSG